MTPPPQQAGDEQLVRVKVAELERNKQRVLLYSNPLGRACYQLDYKGVERCVGELSQGGLLEAGLVFASEVRPLSEERHLSSKELRQFQPEIGCPPLLLACVACESELKRLRQELGISGDASMTEKEKELQQRAAEVLRLLAKNGARIAAADVGHGGNTALHVAARSGAKHLLSALLRLDADILARNADGLNAESLAARHKNVNCQQILQVAAILDMEKQEAAARQLHEEEARKSEQQAKVKEKRKRKKKNRKRSRSQTGGSSSSDSERSVRELQASEGDNEQRRGGGRKASDRKGGSSSGSDRGSSVEDQVGQAPNFAGKTIWNGFDDEDNELDQDDGNSADEWDDARWGEYEDWGEDWDEEALQQSASDGHEGASSGADDEDEVRAEVARLRKEKYSSLQMLYHLAADREARTREIEQLEKQSAKMDERAKRLEEREARMKAGDVRAVEDTAEEVEMSAMYENFATTHARAVWELEKTLTHQQREQQEAVNAMEKELREMRRRTKGLEQLWDHRFAWQISKEMLDRMAAEHRSARLCEEIQRMIRTLDIPPELKERLPPLLVPEGAGAGGGGRQRLPPLEELTVALQVHRRLQDARRDAEAKILELSDFCNEQLRAKDEEVMTALEQQLLHGAFPALRGEDDLRGWRTLANLVARQRQALERASSSAASSDLL